MTSIEVMVDQATGFDPDKAGEGDAMLFVWFVKEFVWDRIPNDGERLQ